MDDWSQGVPLAYLQDLCRHWRALRLAGHRGTAQPARPLPDHDRWTGHPLRPRPVAASGGTAAGHDPRVAGSILEFEEVIGPLTDPPAYGGEARDGFHLVLPSLPGYGFSGKPTAPGWGISRIADAWAELMDRLGYRRSEPRAGTGGAASAPAWPSSTRAGRRPAPHPAAGRARPGHVRRSDPGRAGLAGRAAARGRSEDGYSAEQSTKPQTIGYSLVDSPGRLAAWIVESSAPGPTAAAYPSEPSTGTGCWTTSLVLADPDRSVGRAAVLGEHPRGPADLHHRHRGPGRGADGGLDLRP